MIKMVYSDLYNTFSKKDYKHYNFSTNKSSQSGLHHDQDTQT